MQFLDLPVVFRMKCAIPGREKNIEGAMEPWVRCCAGAFQEQLAKDANVIREKAVEMRLLSTWAGANHHGAAARQLAAHVRVA